MVRRACTALNGVLLVGIGAGIGIANFTFDDAKGFWQWVDICDNGGVDSIWQSDRIIGPVPNLETMSAMAALAGGSKHLKFGMNVASLGLRNPILTATGTPTKGRGKRTDEGLEIMSRLWIEDDLNFQGEYYQLDNATIAPKPIQNPLPLWVGGSAKQAIECTARWGTGWQAGIENADDVAPVIAAIKKRAAELGRCIADDHFGAGFGFRFGTGNEPIVSRYNTLLEKRLGKKPEGFTAVGGVEEMMKLVHEFHAAGVHKFILRPIASGTEEMIQQTKLMVEKLIPEIDGLN